MNDIERKHANARMSKVVCHGGLVYLCGQTANASDSASGDIQAQTKEVLSRIDALLAEGGTDRSRILSVTIYLASMDDFAGMNSVWESWTSADIAPARTTVQAQLASPSLRVEMTVVAAAGTCLA